MLAEQIDALVEEHGLGAVMHVIAHNYGLAQTIDALVYVYDEAGDESYNQAEALLFKGCALDLARVYAKIQRKVYDYEKEKECNEDNVYTHTFAK